LGYEDGKLPSANFPQDASFGENFGFASESGLIDFNPLLNEASTLQFGAGYTQPNIEWAYPSFNNVLGSEFGISPIDPGFPQYYPEISPGLSFPLFDYDLQLPDLSFMEFPGYEPDFSFFDAFDFGDSGDFGPVVLNLDGRGLKLDSSSSSTQFVDTDGSGYEHRTAWAAAGNGVLALDLYGDGKLHQKNQYAFTEWDPTATSDLQALKDVFDTNHNGKIDVGDANWSQFKVVVNGQMVSLASLGIASIDLTPTGSGQTFGDGSAITGTTTYTKSDGTKGQVGDAILAVDSNGYLIRQTQTTNAGGSVTTDIGGSNADGSKAFENVVTLSANGLSKTIKYDDNGDGVFDRSQTVVSVVNSDGSTTQTTSDFNADGSLKDRTASTTSADTRTVTTQIDTNGDSIWDQSQIYVNNVNGSASTTTKNLAANGKVINQTLVTTSTDGLIKTTKTDNSGSGVFDQVKIDSTVVKADGSRVETVSDTGSSGFLIDKQVVTTSADGRSKTVQMDHTGTGTFDLVTTSTIVVGTDKSVTTTVQEKNANGTLRNSNVTVMTADGLSKTVSTDANGDGAVDRVFSDVTVTATGGVKTETVSTKSGNGILLSKTVTTTSSDQKTINTVIDANGDGTNEQTRSIIVNADGSTTTTVSTFAPNGTLVQRTLTTVLAGGLATTLKTDANGDGIYESVTSDTIVVNANGSRTETRKDLSSNGSLIDSSVTTTSADGESQARTVDLDGNGIIDQTETDVITLGADGTRTETVSTTSKTGALLAQTVIVTSADHRTTTTTIDSNGDGAPEEIIESVLNADGSITRTVADPNGDTTEKAISTTTTSANGLSTTTQNETVGIGTTDWSTSDATVLNADGSKTETRTRMSGDQTLLDKVVINTSGNGLSKTTQTDADGDGIYEDKETDVLVLNVDGSKTDTVSHYAGSDSKLIDRAVTTTGADGLSTMVSIDSNGDGTAERISTDTSVLNSNGSSVETTSVKSANGSILSQTTRSMSADGRTINETSSDFSGNGKKTTDVTTIDVDGGRTEVISTYTVDGSQKLSSTTIRTSANGLTTTTSTDLDANGTVDRSSSSITTLNADGSKTVTMSEFKPGGALKDRVATTTSANGLSVTVQMDATGTGVYNRTRTDIKTTNADGSTTETVSNINADGSLHDRVTTIISADKLTTTVNKDINGDGVLDQTSKSWLDFYGDSTTVVSDLQPDGHTVKDQWNSSTNADGLLVSSAEVSSAGQIDSLNYQQTTINEDGSREVLLKFIDSQEIDTISADGMTINKKFIPYDGTGMYADMIKNQTVHVEVRSDGSKLTTTSNYSATHALTDQVIVSASANGLVKRTETVSNIGEASSIDAVDDDVTVLNPDGSTTETITGTRAGILVGRTVTTTQADGLKVTVQHDTTGSGNFDQTEVIEKQVLADGSTIVDVSELDAQAHLKNKTRTNTSGDGKLVTIARDTNGDGIVDQLETVAQLADGSSSDVVTDLAANNAKIGQVTSSTSYDGRTTTIKWDDDGDGVDDQMRVITRSIEAGGATTVTTQDFGISQIGPNGIPVSTTAVLRKSSKTTVSANGRESMTDIDVDGDGASDGGTTNTTNFDGSNTMLVWNPGSMRALDPLVGSAVGSVQWRSAIAPDPLNAPISSSISTSADGLSKTISSDYVGEGNYAHEEDWLAQFSGSWVGTITEKNEDFIVVATGIETISADGRTTTLKEDTHNTGRIDHTDVSVIGIDGSITETVTDLNADGTLQSSSVTTVDATGHHQHTVRNDGSVTDILSGGGAIVGLDGGAPAEKQVGSQVDYDGAGHLKQARATFQDGTSIQERYDIDGSQSWSKIKTWLDAKGQLTRQETFNDDGTSTVFDHADPGGPAAVSTQQHFDAQGRLVGQRDAYADGSHRDVQFDVDGSETWASLANWENSQGTLIKQEVIYDDGTRADYYPLGIHAATGGGDPAAVLTQQTFDANGRQVGERNNFADGSRMESLWDTAGTESWSSVSTWFNAQGEQTRQVINNDDGTGADVTNTYNAQGQSIHQTIVRHDGTRTEISQTATYVSNGTSVPGIAVWSQQDFNAQGTLVFERDNLADGTHIDVLHGVPFMGYSTVVYQYYNQYGGAFKYLVGYPGTLRPVEQYAGAFPGLAPIEAPVVLDLADKGASGMLTPLSMDPLSSAPTFDMAGDGQQHRTAWASSGEGVLAIDADGSGRLDEKKDIVFTEWESGATSDMQALRDVFDTNHDGKLDAADARWSDFRVLVDGKAQTLTQLGIASIGLNPQGEAIQFLDGSSINGTSLFTRTDGSTGLAGDAAFRYDAAPVSGTADSIPNASDLQTRAATQLNQLIAAMANFAPTAGAQSAMLGSGDPRLQASPLMGTAH